MRVKKVAHSDACYKDMVTLVTQQKIMIEKAYSAACISIKPSFKLAGTAWSISFGLGKFKLAMIASNSARDLPANLGLWAFS